MHPGMRRKMWRRMMREMGGWQGGHHAHGSHECWEEPSTEDRIAHLEEYQRDLEQEVADVASKIKRLREEVAGASSDSDSEPANG